MYQKIAPSKAVVGVDKPMKALSMHIQKTVLVKNCLSSQSCYFFKNEFFQTKLLHAYVQCVCIGKAKFQNAQLNALVGLDWPMYGL